MSYFSVRSATVRVPKAVLEVLGATKLLEPPDGRPLESTNMSPGSVLLQV